MRWRLEELGSIGYSGAVMLYGRVLAWQPGWVIVRGGDYKLLRLGGRYARYDCLSCTVTYSGMCGWVLRGYVSYDYIIRYLYMYVSPCALTRAPSYIVHWPPPAFGTHSRSHCLYCLMCVGCGRSRGPAVASSRFDR